MSARVFESLVHSLARSTRTLAQSTRTLAHSHADCSPAGTTTPFQLSEKLQKNTGKKYRRELYQRSRWTNSGLILLPCLFCLGLSSLETLESRHGTTAQHHAAPARPRHARPCGHAPLRMHARTPASLHARTTHASAHAPPKARPYTMGWLESETSHQL